jgi:hypothetical protein
MKKKITILLMLISSLSYAQEATFVKGKGYVGYIFSQEIPIWGFPVEKNRYTPSYEDIFQVEKILKDSISSNYVKSHQKPYASYPINKTSLKKYIRQYVGYQNEHNDLVIWVVFFKKRYIGSQNPSRDIISVQDGGYDYWSVYVNITTKKLFKMNVNGDS